MSTPPLLLDPGVLPPGRLVAAVSGGMDSMVLLHQLRFATGREREVVVAHLDHGMRPGSGADARWLTGVCRAWHLPLVADRLARPPGSEGEARDARYRFLGRVREEAGAGAILTAHHADDQAETVLFRILRGTGLRGLAGIAPSRGDRVRPLLSRWREELEAYAREWNVPWRDDPTNRDPGFARNVLRHRILPEAEARVAAGSRRALVRLAENAQDTRLALEALEEQVFREGMVEVSPGRVEIPTAALDTLPPVLRSRLVRRAATRCGVHLSREATERAAAALATLHPGKGVDLTGGLRLERGPEGWILLGPEAALGHRGARATAPGEGPVVRISGSGEGSATLRLGPADWQLLWGPEPRGEPAVALPGETPFPLTVRGWEAGDRIRLPRGSRSVARLLGEAGIPALDRPGIPVAVDAEREVVWIPGVALSARVGATERSGSGLFLSCARVDRV